jgi:uncharacterized protein YndB with AHSA1/START domain
VDFEITQWFSAPVEAVDAAFVDPAFLERLATLPKLGDADVLAQSREGSIVRQQVRYLFRAQLSGAVRRFVDPDLLTWVEDSTHDLAAHHAGYDIVPDHYGSLLEGRYEARLTEGGAHATTRHVHGTVRVTVPLVGGKVERAIVSGLQENATAQTALLDTWLRDRS